MRILHFSDIHLREPWRTAPLKDWMGKRFVGGICLLLGRWRHFGDTLDADLPQDVVEGGPWPARRRSVDPPS